MTSTSLSTDLQLRQVQALARRLKWVLRGVFVLLLLLPLMPFGPMAISSDLSGAIDLSLMRSDQAQQEIPLTVAWPTALGSIVQLLMMLALFWMIDRLFTAFERSETLGAGKARWLGWIGWTTVLLGVTGFVASSLQSFVLAVMPGHGLDAGATSLEPGAATLWFHFDATVVMAGVVIVAFALIMKRAELIAEDSKLTI